MFDVDDTLSVKPAYVRNAAVLKCLENDFAVGVIAVGEHYRNAHYFCEVLDIKREIPCLCDFFSINKGVTFFQTHRFSQNTRALDQIQVLYPDLSKPCITLVDNEHSHTCFGSQGYGCDGYGGQWSPFGVTDVDVTNLISFCADAKATNTKTIGST
jgi:hypothetical protein